MPVPLYRLTFVSPEDANSLAGLCQGRGYIGASSDGATFLFRWGGPIDHLFTIGEWARDCDLAGDVEVSEFFMQAAKDVA
jgi:hypothetical protein